MYCKRRNFPKMQEAFQLFNINIPIHFIENININKI